MEGIFAKRITVKGLLLYALGAGVLGFFAGKIFSLVAGPNLLMLLYALWALGCAVYAVAIAAFFLNNRKAYLKMEADRITARYGLGKKLECKPDELGYASVGANLLTLEVGGKLHDIGGLVNIGDLAQWLKNRVPFIVPKDSQESLLAAREQAKRSRKANLILGIGFFVLAAVMLFVSKKFLSGKDLFTLSAGDLVVYGLLLVAFIGLMIAGALCIRKVSLAMRQLTISRDKLRCLAIATTPLPEHDVIGVFYDGYAVRLSLCADQKDRVYYVSEKMGNDFALHPHKSYDPTEDTEKVNAVVDQMRDISFLFGME